MAEPEKDQIGDGQDNFGQAAGKAIQAAKQISHDAAAEAAVKGAEQQMRPLQWFKPVRKAAKPLLKSPQVLPPEARGAQFFPPRGQCATACSRFWSASACSS